ncbi:MAG: PAS domain-containing protein [Chloroflexi bacterium]|nr:PAS domain-containing protein [Chloroflexota bacterium]
MSIQENPAHKHSLHALDVTPLLIWGCDARGKTNFLNKKLLQFIGLELAAALATSWKTYIHPDDYLCLKRFEDALRQQEGFSAEYRLRRADGVYRWVSDQVVVHYDEAGAFAGFLGTATDITEQKQAREAEQAAWRLYETMGHVTLALTARLHLDEVLEEIVEQIQRLFGHEATNIMLLDNETLRPVHWKGYSSLGSETLIRNLQQSLNVFPVDREASATHRPVLVKDTHHDARWVRLASTEWIRSNITAPICYHDQIIGMVRLDSAQVNYFKEEDVERIIPLTHAAAIALANAMLYQQAQREIDERKRVEDEMRVLNQRLEEHVQDRTAQLNAALERLQELDNLKSKFVADVSHELRTPIAVLSLKLELLERWPERFPQHLPEMQRQIEQLTTLVTDILELSRADLRAHRVDLRPVDLNVVVKQVAEAHMAPAEAAGLVLALTLPEDNLIVRGEPNQLAQVVTNLISNAIKYTAAGSIMVITQRLTLENGAQKKEYICLRVQDTGIGIPEADLPHLFERFYRGQQVGALGISGTGLGLAIVKDIVDLHGGEISIESRVGVGSIFQVLLPAEEL